MSTPDLYFSPQPTRSARARWAFVEAGLSYEPHQVDVFAGEQKSEAYLAVNPLGVVPTAVFDGQPVVESSALALIASTGTPLLPEVGTAAWRSALQWAVFAPAELDHLLATLNAHRLFRPPAQRDPQLVAETVDKWNTRADRIARSLGDGPYLLGEAFSVADICVGHSLVWAKMHGLLESNATLGAYLARLSERPAFREVYPPSIDIMPDPHANAS
ncbi:MAG: glutathione S-transferase family protein [Myxococcota bacterium]